MRRSTFDVVRYATIGLFLLAAIAPASVTAFPVTNCSVAAQSSRADGSALDVMASGDASASASDPFEVDWNGQVKWSGSSQIELKDNTYKVTVFGLPTPIQGTSPNGDDNRQGDGSQSVSANAPFRFTGTYEVYGEVKGSGGTCSGTFYAKLIGDPIGTIPFWIALGLLIVGGLMLARGFGNHRATAVVGGVVFGLGLAVVTVIYSALLFGGLTPLGMVAIGLAIGVVDAIVGRSRARTTG